MKKEPARVKYRNSAILIVVLVLIGLLILIFKLNHHPKLTGYETENGVIYSCSRPIRAKQGAARGLLGQPQGLIPYSEAEANKYCHSIGIE
jgi:hypothetical protein